MRSPTRSLLTAASLLLIGGCVILGFQKSAVPSDCLQLLLVVGDGMDRITGSLQRFERESSQSDWKRVGESIPVVLGRKGLAWGEGLHKKTEHRRPQKREGDGRSPAGLFTLGPAFGMDSLLTVIDLKTPYFTIVDGLEGVDDAASRYYNQIVLKDTVKSVDWHSSEILILYTHAYGLGVVVNHNKKPVRPGHGSQIFLHIWSGPASPTAGCTAMAAEDMAEVLQWMDSGQSPILAQLPLESYHSLRVSWNLPTI